MIINTKYIQFQSDNKEQLTSDISQWTENNKDNVTIISKEYKTIINEDMSYIPTLCTKNKTSYFCNIKYKELHPELLYNINFHFGEYMINSYYNTVNTVFSSIVDVFNPTNPLHYQVILLDKPITELEIYGLIKAYEDGLIERENNRNLRADIVGQIMFSKGSYNIKDDCITIKGGKTTYIRNASMYMADIYKKEILKNANNLLVIKFDVTKVPKRTLLDKILFRNYHSCEVFYDEFDDSDY